MNNIIDFSNSEIVTRPFGGSDRKFRIKFENKYYMLKFTEEHLKKSDMSTSHENNAISEYLSSHIAQSIGLDVHNTILGEYRTDLYSDSEICVACEDFRTLEEENIEFSELAKSIYNPSEFKKIPQLTQIYAIYNSPIFPKELKEEGLKRFWETMIVDALIGNFDRHSGNWGIISNIKTGEKRLAPIYDFGSTLFPIMSDEGIKGILNDKEALVERCYLFPSATLYLTKEKTGKPSYYDLLSSNYDEQCTKALLNIFPKISIGNIYSIIDNTPVISDIRKEFYKKIITFRYELIIHKAYELCKTHNYDLDALNRLKNNISVTKKDIPNLITSNSSVIDKLMSLNYANNSNVKSNNYIKNTKEDYDDYDELDK